MDDVVTVDGTVDLIVVVLGRLEIIVIPVVGREV